MPDRPPPARSHADQTAPTGDPEPGRPDTADTPDPNPHRYAGPRPADGEQNITQDRFPVPGSPTGPTDRPAPGPRHPGRYRKRPAVIEAIRWTTETTGEVREFLGDAHLGDINPGRMRIDTLEGPIAAALGDWVIRGIAGEFYPCRSDIFEATYEATDEPPTTPPDPGAPWGCR